MSFKLVDGAGRDLSLEDICGQVGKGWTPLITSLISDLISMGWDGEVCQVKEKFGCLRFYVGNGSNKVFERIDQAELLSSSICEECGKEGKNSGWGKGWLLTLCPEHGEEYKKLDILREK